MTPTRTLALQITFLVVCALPTSSCKDDDGGAMETGTTGMESSTTGTTDPGPCPNGASAVISANHNHALEIPQSDILAGQMKVYSIQGTALHDHTVEMTPEDFALLQQEQPVFKTSSLYAQVPPHAHTMTISCD